MRSDGVGGRLWLVVGRVVVLAAAVIGFAVGLHALREADRCDRVLYLIGQSKPNTPNELQLVNEAQDVCIDPKEAVATTVVLKLHQNTRLGLRFMRERVRRQPDVYLNWALLSQTAEDLEDYDLSDRALDQSERLKPIVPGEEEEEG